jgi:DNA polymerase III epsilon subunit family exonuclease
MTFSLLDSLRQVPLAFFDVETTGASTAHGHRVIEIGIIRVEGGMIVADFEQLIDPRRPIGPGISALTGITGEMVQGQPTFRHVLPRVCELMSGAVLVGHNVGFDLSFVASEYRWAGDELTRHCAAAHILDTVRIARKLYGRGGNGLQRLSRRLGYTPAIAHRALPDAITTYEVFSRMFEPLGSWDLPLCDAIVHQGGARNLSATAAEDALPLELLEALEQRCDVLMEYVDANNRTTQRTIQPIQLRKVANEIVLVAHCHLRNDRRNFKLDRIVSLTRLADLQQTDPTRISTPA